jgi:chemotaxis response regulator CheB
MPDVTRLTGDRVRIECDRLPDGSRSRVLLTRAAQLPRVAVVLTGTGEDGAPATVRAALTADDCVAVAEWLLRYAQRVRPRS